MLKRIPVVALLALSFVSLTGASLIDQETRERIIRLEDEAKRQSRLLETLKNRPTPSSDQPAILEKLGTLEERMGRLETKEVPPPPAVAIPDWSDDFADLDRRLWMLVGLSGAALILGLATVTVRITSHPQAVKCTRPKRVRKRLAPPPMIAPKSEIAVTGVRGKLRQLIENAS